MRRTAAAALLMCAVMVLVAGAPLAMGVVGDVHSIVKKDRGPRASAVTWEFATGADYGVWSGYIVNSGLRSLVVDVADNTTGTPEEVSHQRIRFAAYGIYPSGTMTTDNVT
ncbi:MAG TPA: hypothetical protein VGB78_10460, partial [Thermoplasmata archaeon]